MEFPSGLIVSMPDIGYCEAGDGRSQIHKDLVNARSANEAAVKLRTAGFSTTSIREAKLGRPADLETWVEWTR